MNTYAFRPRINRGFRHEVAQCRDFGARAYPVDSPLAFDFLTRGEVESTRREPEAGNRLMAVHGQKTAFLSIFKLLWKSRRTNFTGGCFLLPFRPELTKHPSDTYKRTKEEHEARPLWGNERFPAIPRLAGYWGR
jgi:hypothetical protein